MGVVYQARHIKLNRVVALKMILAGGHAGEDELARFKTEADAVARLQHPHIVQIYEVGQQGGLPFSALEYCPGGSLEAKLRGTPLPARDATRLVEVLARAMDAAHQKGIVHRDLKPANILLTPDGTPKVSDFGLAKKLDASAGPTASGAIMGTPSYMAPEQAGGQSKVVGPPADVYALGAVLYECLTGRPPFKAATPLDTMLQVLSEEPVPPRLLQPGVPRDLETICLKCLEKEPAKRYRSAAALADDLGRYQNGESIQARGFNVLDRLTRTLERNQYDVEFGSWGTMLLWFAAIVVVGHAATYALIQAGRPHWLLWTGGCTQLALLALVFWRYRAHTRRRATTAERQLWAIWLGYLVAYLTSSLVSSLLMHFEVLAAGPGAPVRWDALVVYPGFAVLSGLGFFVMGGCYWGRCYAIGLAFFALAFVMAWRLELAPLEFGLAWGATLAGIGLHLCRLGRVAAVAAASARTATVRGEAHGDPYPSRAAT
jgi:serine/threonine-protein kinase